MRKLSGSFFGSTYINSDGISLLELLIVISIVSLLAVLSIPNFFNFGKSEELKASALNLKSYLRLAQNNALSGVIEDTATGDKCPFPQALKGWEINLRTTDGGIDTDGFPDNQFGFQYKGRCAPGDRFGQKYIPFTLNTVSITNIEFIDVDLPIEPVSAEPRLFILFNSPGANVEFYKNNSLNQKIDSEYDFAQITLTHAQTAEQYQVIINTAGNIYEKAI